jgi:flagellar biosynthesis GTPase FlhF
MLDKQELISSLRMEEFRIQKKYQDKYQRRVLFRSIVVAIIAVVIVMGWPLWQHVAEVAAVNWVVYTDRKKLEITKCFEYKTVKGFLGVFLMTIVDGLQWWLTVSVLLSWVTTSKYFFPIPSLPIRPAQFMGEKVASGPMGRYGMNVAPMAVTWTLRFVQGQLEKFTAQALSEGYKNQKKQAREFESLEEKAARKAARKATKRAAKEEAERQRQMNLEQEAQRRKEMAQQATEQLFGRRTQPASSEGEFLVQQRRQNIQPTEEEQLEQHQEMQPSQDSNDDEDDIPLSKKEELEAKRQFEADLEELDDINDLD